MLTHQVLVGGSDLVQERNFSKNRRSLAATSYGLQIWGNTLVKTLCSWKAFSQQLSVLWYGTWLLLASVGILYGAIPASEVHYGAWLRRAHCYAAVWLKALPIQSFSHLLSQLSSLHLGLRLVLPLPASSLSPDIPLHKSLTVLTPSSLVSAF